MIIWFYYFIYIYITFSPAFESIFFPLLMHLRLKQAVVLSVRRIYSTFWLTRAVEENLRDLPFLF